MKTSSGRGCQGLFRIAVSLMALNGAVNQPATAVTPEPVPAPVPEAEPLPANAVAPDVVSPDKAALKPPSKVAANAAAKADPPSNTDGRCDQCGSCRGVRRVCVATPVEREKTKVCWSSKEEVQCIPGRSIFCGKKCGQDECGCYSFDLWKPTCARVITKTVPVKQEVTRKVPGFDWKVEEQCCTCRGRAAEEPACGAH